MLGFRTKKLNNTTQYERLKFISSEARRIRMMHQKGEISARVAAKMLKELRENPSPKSSLSGDKLTAA